MKRLTRVAAFLYEHERIDGAQFEALFEGSLAPSADVERQWRSARSNPRSWEEIDHLIASTVRTGETVAVARAAQPLQIQLPRRRARHALRCPRSPAWLLLSWCGATGEVPARPVRNRPRAKRNAGPLARRRAELSACSTSADDGAQGGRRSGQG